MTIKVAFLGFGRMGRAAAKAVMDTDGMELSAAFDPGFAVQDAGLLMGRERLGIEVEDPSGMDKIEADVALDFSSADACVKNSEACAAGGTALIVGVTGLKEEQLAELRANGDAAGIVISPNMSIGVNVFWQLIGEAAKKLRGYDIEVIEAHHKSKKDAPSGTAMKAVEILADAVGSDIKEDVVYGRNGHCPRKEGEIGVHAIRAGDIVGEHTVIFSTQGERFEVGHIGHTRESFASGIPQAVRFIAGKQGCYDMGDVLGLR